MKDKQRIKALKIILGANASVKSIYETNTKKTFAVSPTPASVLYCLLLDAQAIDNSFMNWAEELGYDQDSLKALNTYNACCVAGKQLNNIFSRKQLSELSELMYDY